MATDTPTTCTQITRNDHRDYDPIGTLCGLTATHRGERLLPGTPGLTNDLIVTDHYCRQHTTMARNVLGADFDLIAI